MQQLQRVLQTALLYFVAVFGAGFLLGIGRTLYLEPLVGKTEAVAIELPFLIGVMVFAAIWAPQRSKLEPSPVRLLGAGLGALFLQQCADIILGAGLRGTDLALQFAYLQTPAGRLYLGALALFALMPILVWIVGRGLGKQPAKKKSG